MTRPLYQLRIPSEVAALIRSMHPELKRKMRASLQKLVEDPFLGKMLKDDLSGYRSYRVGTFRIIYQLSGEHEIVILTIGPRVSVYGDTLRLIQRQPRTSNGHSRYSV